MSKTRPVEEVDFFIAWCRMKRKRPLADTGEEAASRVADLIYEWKKQGSLVKSPFGKISMEIELTPSGQQWLKEQLGICDEEPCLPSGKTEGPG